MDGDDEAVTKKVVRRSRPAKPKRSRPSAPATPSGPPVYGTPPGTDPALPVYGSRDSAKPVEPARHDFDPRAEEKAAAAKAADAAAKAAAAARQAKAAKVARAAKVRAQERAAEKAAKAQAARAAYAAKKERTARIAEETRQARLARTGTRGSRSSQRARERQFGGMSRMPGRGRTEERIRRFGTWPQLLFAALISAGVIFIPIIVTNSSPPSSTVSDGVDWTRYPGQYDGDAQKTLASPRQEEAVAENTALLAELRAAVDDEIAVSWIEHGSATERSLENSWGGPSLLNEWTSPRWYTTEPISGQKLKQRLVDRVSEVLSEHGFEDPRLVNDPDTSFYSPRSIERLYGGSKPATQVVWELKATSVEDEYVDFTFTITDLSKDKTGQFAEDAERNAEYLDTPVSSMAMTLTSSGLLAASDAPEFRERAATFEDKEPPRG